MTDLNKESELCNLSFEKYWDDFCKAYGNGFDRSLAKLFFANAWGEAKAQAVPDTHIVVPRTREIVVAIEKIVQQQCDASGVQEPLHRLDGWRILEEIAEKVKEIKG
ncbi:hypothetical protein QDR98_02110 [Acinetobacter baumannii]|uniref:hypothetical protein n=1 Tax=Acinetobacter baumannii TaxID=470 RepID=UPI002449BD49|nr:hypothetical protein [Acinetobacter baumannii]MDH2664774.1 hypothetical protein [Acinetobacter baumannii]